MDLTNNVAGTEFASQAWTTVSNVAARVRNRAKAKKAQGIADAGNYFTLTAFQKSLIPVPQYVIDQVSGQGITKNAVLNLPAQPVGSSNAGIISQLKTLSSGGTLNAAVIGEGGVIGTAPAADPKELTDTTGTKIKNMLPYIIGVAVVGFAIYFVAKRR